MKILINTQYFYPEPFKINDLVTELVSRGHDVTVLTGKPNYPGGKFYKGYGLFSPSSEQFNGARVIRVPLIPRGSGGGVRLALNYLSYALSASVRVLFIRSRYDASLTFATSPITSSYPAIFWKWLHRKTRTAIWVQDLWPESVVAASDMQDGWVLKVLNRVVRHIYKHHDLILIQSREFAGSIAPKITDSGKLKYIPNWAESVYEQAAIADDVGALRAKLGIPEGFVVLFAGNIGEAQDFDALIKAVIRTRDDERIKWVVVGDGRKRKEVEAAVRAHGLERKLLLLGRHPMSEMPAYFHCADLLLLSLKDEAIFTLTIPSKLQCYLASAKPVVGMLNGAGARVIRESGAGRAVAAGDFEGLARAVAELASKDAAALREMGKAGYTYYKKEFDREKVISDIERILGDDLSDGCPLAAVDEIRPT